MVYLLLGYTGKAQAAAKWKKSQEEADTEEMPTTDGHLGFQQDWSGS